MNTKTIFSGLACLFPAARLSRFLRGSSVTAAVIALFMCLQSVSAFEWSFELGETSIIPNTPNVPTYRWFPDGHITVLPTGDGMWMMFWSEWESYRTIGETQFPESQITLEPTDYVCGGRGTERYPEGDLYAPERFDNHGTWIQSVFRKSGDTLIGFAHCERTPVFGYDAQWKSVGVMMSFDNGKSFTEPEQIISQPWPGTDTWGGAGDLCVIRDSTNNRWVCFYSDPFGIKMAISEDPDGRPGTWYKYYNEDFTEPGIDGRDTCVPGLVEVRGANPSVHYNTYMKRWVIMYHAWAADSGGYQNAYISTSPDLLNWEEPRVLVRGQQLPAYGGAWYPNIIGETDLIVGQTGRLYYANFVGGRGREFTSRSITFEATGIVDPSDVMPKAMEAVNFKAGLLNITEAGAVSIQVKDLMGKTIYGKNCQAPMQWNIREASAVPGLYVVTIKMGSRFLSQKLLSFE